LLLALAVGCSSPTTSLPAADEEGAVRAQFAALQSAIKAGDVDKLWMMLVRHSIIEAERAAMDIQNAYAKAGKEEKAKQEAELGLAGAELAGLRGKGLLKTKGVQGKFHELPDSTIEKVAVKGDYATVNYLEPDGAKEELILFRQDDQWKVWLEMPKVSNTRSLMDGVPRR
jgi:hypothetical protein